MNNPRIYLLSLAVAASLAGNALAQNDDCTGAIAVVNGPNGPFSNSTATTSAPAWTCAFGDADVWFQFACLGTGTLTADTCGAGFDTVMEIFDGSAGCGSLVSLGCNDDFCGLQSSMTVPATPGIYYIRVGGFLGATGSFTLNVNGPVGSGTLATNSATGAGCISAFASYYEIFATAAAFDLASSSISMLPAGGGYIVLPGITSYVPPSGTATVLALGDDDETTVSLTGTFAYPGGTTSTLTVCSNGFVSVGGSNGVDYDPDVAEMLGAADTGYWAWHDHDPTLAGSGQVKFEQIGSVAYITWDGVWDYGGASAADANTFQFQFDTATGQVSIVFQTMSTGGNARLVGYSPGGPSANPGNRDISATLPATFTLSGSDVLPLALAGSSRPITGTTWTLSTSNVPGTAVIGVDVFGFADPGLNDLTFLGMPGCGLRSSLDVLVAWIPAGSTHAYALPIPANPALVNIHVFTTSAAFVPGVNPFGAITANGIDAKIGDV